MVGMSESWLDKGVSDVELAVMGMRMYRKDRNRRGGWYIGVCIGECFEY